MLTRYVQKLSLRGREKWIGWEIDGVGTEIPGLFLADRFSSTELLAHGVTSWVPMSFDQFLGLTARLTPQSKSPLGDEDVLFRMDALRVALDRRRSRDSADVPKAFLLQFFFEDELSDSRIESMIAEWQKSGAVEIVGRDDCYLRIRSRML
ncbi:MAG TPA: hypothetical protein VMT00_12540 [Thermoanaerobaculia bacterium]|nr:hypothetical protein [Thermoanaerobaculia bacterium]